MALRRALLALFVSSGEGLDAVTIALQDKPPIDPLRIAILAEDSLSELVAVTMGEKPQIGVDRPLRPFQINRALGIKPLDSF